MGRYINPLTMSKEEFLYTVGKPIPRTFKWSELPEGYLPVVLVDNGNWSAAAICSDEADFQMCLEEEKRPIECFLLRVEDIVKEERHPLFLK